MATPSDIISDLFAEVSYPFDHRVVTDWLRNYVQYVRSSEATVEALRSQVDRFEMVPFPRELLSGFGPFGGLLGTSSDPGQLTPEVFFGRPGLRERGEQVITARAYPQVVELFRNLVGAMEHGDRSVVDQIVADDYIDHEGRDKRRLMKAFEELMAKATNLRIIPAHIQEAEVVGCNLVVRVTGAWEAVFDDERVSEFFELEAVVLSNKECATLVSVRHLS